MENNVKEKSNIGIIIAILCILLLASIGFICYDKFLKKEEPKPSDCNCQVCEKCNCEQKQDEITADIYGTYYNTDEEDVYFTLNSDNTCVLREPSCGDTPVSPKTLSCKTTMENDKVLLSIDVNSDQISVLKLVGTKDNGIYRFKADQYPEYYSCAISSESYFTKK